MEVLLARVLEARPQPKLVEHVDMKTKLDALGLGQLFPPGSWPPPAAVRELQHKAKGLEKVGVKRPFVACDLRKYVFFFSCFLAPPPQFACSVHSQVLANVVRRTRFGPSGRGVRQGHRW